LSSKLLGKRKKLFELFFNPKALKKTGGQKKRSFPEGVLEQGIIKRGDLRPLNFFPLKSKELMVIFLPLHPLGHFGLDLKGPYNFFGGKVGH